jgi:hypothetical protein
MQHTTWNRGSAEAGIDVVRDAKRSGCFFAVDDQGVQRLVAIPPLIRQLEDPATLQFGELVHLTQQLSPVAIRHGVQVLGLPA